MTSVSIQQCIGSANKPVRARERKPRGRGLRTRTGCITCRKRHLKCNEIKPVCGPCTRSNHACVYADSSTGKPASTVISTTTPTSIPAPPSSTGCSDQIPSRTASNEPCDLNTRPQFLQDHPGWDRHPNFTPGPVGWGDHLSISRRSSPNPWQPSVSVAGEPLSPGALYAHSLMQPSASSQSLYSHASSDDYTNACQISSAAGMADIAIAKWFGQLAVDAELEGAAGPVNFVDLRQAAEGHRILNAHNMANAQQHMNGCFPSPSSSGVSVGTPRRGSQPNPPAADSHLWQSTTALSLQPHEVGIFNHFVSRISQWIDLFDPIRHFSTVVPHLAMHNVGLLNAILALSIRHLSLGLSADRGRTPDRNDALPYYYETLHYVQKAMQYDSYNTSDELLATCLIISAYEMLDGSRRDWERHLQGVFWIQRSQVIHGDSDGLKQAVWWAWLCQDVWAAFREKRKPFNSWTPTRKYSDMNSYELAARSVYLMAQVVAYCSDEEVAKAKIDPKPRIAKAEALLNMLDEWQQHLPVEFNPLPVETEPSAVFKRIWVHPPAFAVAIQAHYAARILLLLHRPCPRGYGDFVQQQMEVSKYAETICGLAATTAADYASSISSSQCLFVAGLCMKDARQRKEVLRLLDVCQSYSGWPIKSLSEDLERIWNGSNKNPLQ